jgi:hypothetical protein
MKLVVSLMVASLAIVACNNKPGEPEQAKAGFSYFGDTINEDGAMPTTELLTLLHDKDSIPAKVTGTITEVCQKKGCWMKMDLGNNLSMRVTFKDYGFFVPKDANGKIAVIDGYAYNDTISVEELRHYAEDGGSSKEDIEKITEPEVEYSFEANGVILKNE